MAPVLSNREAIEAAAAILRRDQLPPRAVRDPIIKRLDAIALALALGNLEAAKSERKVSA